MLALPSLDELKRRYQSINAGFKIPPKQWWDAWGEATKYTPDIWNLERYEAVWLFVYGNEMLRHPLNEHMLDVFEPKLTAFTFENFTMMKHSLGAETYPIVLEKKMEFEDRHWFKSRNELPWAKVKGELYLVPPSVIYNLDRHRENGVKFVRKRTQLIVPYHVQRYPHHPLLTDCKAWMYVGDKEYWEDMMTSGIQQGRFSPVRHFPAESKTKKFAWPKTHRKTYYLFTFSEYGVPFENVRTPSFTRLLKDYA